MSKLRIGVVIPAYNEELAIGEVVNAIRVTLEGKYQYEIVVVDNNSTDRTAEVAEAAGARIVRERRQGYGHALMKGFESVSGDAEIVVMLDGDGSYPAEAIPSLIQPILNDKADFVIGARVEREKGAISASKQLGNSVLNLSLRFAGVRVSDGQSGFRAMRREVVDRSHWFLLAGGMSFVDEMLLHVRELGFRIAEVPIAYHCRVGKSKLNPISDGAEMLTTVVRVVRDYSPIKFFGLMFVLAEIGAFVLAGYIMYEYFYVSYLHKQLSLIAVLLAVTGVQLLTIGLLASMVRNAFRATYRLLTETVSLVEQQGKKTEEKSD